MRQQWGFLYERQAHVQYALKKSFSQYPAKPKPQFHP
jgi:hypothetical protein